MSNSGFVLLAIPVGMLSMVAMVIGLFWIVS
jgi:hypothetical protein